jgi:hypothetical protein
MPLTLILRAAGAPLVEQRLPNSPEQPKRFRVLGVSVVGFGLQKSRAAFTALCLAKTLAEIRFCNRFLQRLDVLGLPALGSFNNVELHRLAFFQAAKAVRLDRREMHEYIFAILAADESKALGVIEPLHCSLFHDVAVFLCFVLRWF